MPNSATQVADSGEYHAAAMLGFGLGWGVCEAATTCFSLDVCQLMTSAMHRA